MPDSPYGAPPVFLSSAFADALLPALRADLSRSRQRRPEAAKG